MLRDPFGSAMSPVLALGQPALTHRAGALGQQIYPSCCTGLNITFLSSSMVSHMSLSPPVGLCGKQARISWGFKPGLLPKQGLYNPSSIHAPGCQAFVFPLLLRHKYFEPAKQFQSCFKKREEGLIVITSVALLENKQQNKAMQLCESRLQGELNPSLATREATSLGDRQLPATQAVPAGAEQERWLQPLMRAAEA